MADDDDKTRESAASPQPTRFYQPSKQLLAKHKDAPSKFASLVKLAARKDNRALLAAASQRGDELSEAIAQLERQSSQYQQQLELKREAKAESEELRREKSHAHRLLKVAVKELRAAQERLEPFNDAASKLKEAGMRDIPHLYATGVAEGKIHPDCFFNTYMNDAVRNVHQATHHTCMLLASNPGC
jgi:seryl-tRNA synthetase